MRRISLAALLVPLLVAGGASAADGGAVARGEQVYAAHCVMCHGMNGAGVPASSRVVGQPGVATKTPGTLAGPSLQGVGAQAADFYVRTGYMPLLDSTEQPRRRSAGERLLDERQIEDVIAYVATIGGGGPPVPKPRPERGDVAEGMRLFTSHCAGCHQIAAQGGVVTGAVVPPLTKATPTQIAEAVRIGPYVMPSFSEQTITRRQLDSVIAYVLEARSGSSPGGWSIGRIGPVPEGMVAWLLAGSVLVATCVLIGTRARS